MDCSQMSFTSVLLLLAQFSIAHSQSCYSCTTLDADQLLREVSDPDWQQWLNRVRNVPKTEACGMNFNGDDALTKGAIAQPCQGGICMKLWFKEKNGGDQMWRTCIPSAKGQVRTDCTRISSSEGDMEVCTCDGDLCNGASTVRQLSLFVLVLISLVIFYCKA